MIAQHWGIYTHTYIYIRIYIYGDSVGYMINVLRSTVQYMYKNNPSDSKRRNVDQGSSMVFHLLRTCRWRVVSCVST